MAASLAPSTDQPSLSYPFFVLSSQVLRGMDLYVGAGGLGYLDHVSLLPDGTPDPNGCAHAATAHLPRFPSPSRRRLPDMPPLLTCPLTNTRCCSAGRSCCRQTDVA